MYFKGFKYSQHSLREWSTLHPCLQLILDKVLMTNDFRIDQGGRTEREQWDYYKKGTSKLHPPDGKHLIKKLSG
ncbi:hypothetical protein LCGC14_0746790, partial [marine sediment metagenome]